MEIQKQMLTSESQHGSKNIDELTNSLNSAMSKLAKSFQKIHDVFYFSNQPERALKISDSMKRIVDLRQPPMSGPFADEDHPFPEPFPERQGVGTFDDLFEGFAYA